MKTERVDLESNEAKFVEDAVFAILKGRGTDMSIHELLESLGDRGIDEGALRATITHLLAESKLVLSPRRRIHIALNGHR
jgi:hypothetical protein